MFNNFDDEQEHFSYLTPEELSPLQAGGSTFNSPVATNPVAPSPRVAEDMFATVDKPSYAKATEDKASPATNANFNPAPSARPTFSPNSGTPLGANPGLANPLTPTAMPGHGSFKYLIIGIVTLLVVLGGAYATYEFILKPQFQTMETPAVSPVVAEPQITPEPVATDTQVEPTTTETTATSSLTQTDSTNVGVATMTPDANLQTGVTTSTVPNAILDTDGDGLTDADEINIYHTNSNKVDTDDDGLNDREEVKIYKTDPNNPDTDGDNYKDGAEVKGGYNPNGQGRLLIVK